MSREEGAELQLYIVRHGETDLNRDGSLIVGRSSHVPINDTGIGQARATGESFVDMAVEPEAVYRSPAIRTRQTATFCLEVMGCRVVPHVDERLHELSMGAWEGNPRNKTYTEDTLAIIRQDPANFRAPAGESFEDVKQRGQAFLEDVVSRHYREGETNQIFAFSHGLATRIWVGNLLGWTTEEMRQAHLTPNASATLLTYEPEQQWRVAFVGKTALAPVP